MLSLTVAVIVAPTPLVIDFSAVCLITGGLLSTAVLEVILEGLDSDIAVSTTVK